MEMQEEMQVQKDYREKVKEHHNGKFLTYCILTMGCQLNENDSEKLSGMLEEMGYQETKSFEEADLVLFNTCCVRENAEERLFGKLGELKNRKAQKGTMIAIGGCMMQEQHMVDKIKKSYPFVDVIFGTHTLHRFPQDLWTAIQKRTKVRDVITIDGEIQEGLPIKRESKTKASVTIMNGCNNFCSYCIVPYVRGRERSRKSEDILKEIQELAKEGYKEITLLGQNVNSYQRVEREQAEKEQRKLEDSIDSFAKLLRAVNEVDGIERIRFISPHPKDFTEDVIEAIRDCDKVSKLVHLPLQSGSSKILKDMNRKYTKEQYLNLVGKMRSIIPGVAFSTDIIVGFPGETEEDFEDTLAVIKEARFEQVYMFIYSRRVGTPADTMENQIPEEIKHQRFDRLKHLVDGQVQQNNQKYMNTIQKVVVDGPSKNDKSYFSGRTDSNKIVIFKPSKTPVEEILYLKILEEHKWYLKGEEIG